MKYKNIIFRVHAIRRMFERKVSEEEVRDVLQRGEVVESYSEDQPYPSRLVLGWAGSRPLHVVAAENAKDNELIVITVYEPASDQWEQDFKRRKK